MDYLLQVVLLSAHLTGALIFTGMAVTGVVRGRLKVEPNQPSIIFRDQPAKFASIVLLEIGFAALFIAVLVRLAPASLK
jgi:hypothetical protein